MSERSAGIVLRDLRMRPVVEAAERSAWDGLMEALKGRFAHLPQANGHYAARQGEALCEVVRPGCPSPPPPSRRKWMATSSRSTAFPVSKRGKERNGFARKQL